MTARVVIYLLICSLLRLMWVIEQPSSSLLEAHPLFAWLCSKISVYKVFIWMGAYGGDSPKPTVLYSNYQFIYKLYCPLPKGKVFEAEMSNKYVDSSGQLRVSGGSDLKMSQHYPERFGIAVFELYMDHRKQIMKEVKNNQEALLNGPIRKELKDPCFNC
ncbi:unnamed protein product [Durusdinium trenchii]|uniref:Uncharacterized protein n=2 Tax=Durusdinium trenchii TaxID=1381693 RepID=A0ABP0IL34_9DINO